MAVWWENVPCETMGVYAMVFYFLAISNWKGVGRK